MRIVVDTNRIIAGLIKEGAARRIITSDEITFYTLPYVIEEINKYKEYIIEKSEMGEVFIDLLLSLFMESIVIVNDEEIKTKMPEAKKLMDTIDEKDAPIIACALAISNDGIWTEDKHFEKQGRIKIWKTKELEEYLQKIEITDQPQP